MEDTSSGNSLDFGMTVLTVGVWGNCLSEVAWHSYTLSTQLARFPGQGTGVLCALCPGASSSQTYNIVKYLLLSYGEGLGK